MKKQVASIQTDKRIMIPIIIAMIGVLGGSIFLYVKYVSPSKKTTTQKMDPKKEAESLMTKIGALYDLPKGENPTIATVSDKTKLEKQSFFAKAENGDKVLIYSTAKKAILYRPSINKIMEVAPLVVTAPATMPVVPTINVVGVDPRVDPSPVSKKVSVSIYNGTKTAGLASISEEKIKEKLNTVEVIEKGNAIKDYTKTIVIDILGTNKTEVKSIADLLGGSVSSLPAGEKSPQGEILVIMGK